MSSYQANVLNLPMRVRVLKGSEYIFGQWVRNVAAHLIEHSDGMFFWQRKRGNAFH